LLERADDEDFSNGRGHRCTEGQVCREAIILELASHRLETPKTVKRHANKTGDQSVKRPRISTPAGSGEAVDDLKPVAPMKWLYVSRLHPQTSEEAVTKKLCSALNVDPSEFKCVKLVPRMEDPSFISFKVGLTEELLQRSLAPEVWPPGIAVRKFVNRPRFFFGTRAVRI
jgi:hypothetical protein